MASLLGLLNRLLPFATPGTPIIQDLLHLGAICALLYFAPQIQERLRTGERRNEAVDVGSDAFAQPEPIAREAEHLPVNDGPNVDPVNPEVHAGDDGNDQEDADPVDHAEGVQAGPARAPDLANSRNVGAKKAKSLARRDQRRAYHEFQRSQGDAQRARDAEGAAEREAVLAAERERRRAAETALEAKRAKEREQKRQREEAEWNEGNRRRLQAIEIVRKELESRKMCDLFTVARQLGSDVDEEWVEKVVNASGLVGSDGDTMTMITSMGWAVRVTADEMTALYTQAVQADLGDDNGRIDHEALGSSLQTILEQGVVT